MFPSEKVSLGERFNVENQHRVDAELVASWPNWSLNGHLDFVVMVVFYPDRFALLLVSQYEFLLSLINCHLYDVPVFGGGVSHQTAPLEEQNSCVTS